MKITRTVIAVMALFGLAGCTTVQPPEYYTQVNIWYMDPSDIRTTNYHEGAILPFGTKVTVNGLHRDLVRFTTASEIGFTLYLKHSLISMEDNFYRYFSTEDPTLPGTPYDSFTEMEKENLKKGNVVLGMSKSAVLASYGFPPSHVNPDLNADFWRYWMSFREEVHIYFKDNLVSEIKKVSISGPPPGRKAFTSVSSLLE